MKLGERFHLKRTSSKDAGLSLSDPDSSFASSNATPHDDDSSSHSNVIIINNNNGNDSNMTDSRGKMGGLNALGAKMRSLSSGGKKLQTGTGEKQTTRAPSLSKFPASQSRTSLLDEGKKSNRNSRFFASSSTRPKSEALSSSMSTSSIQLQEDKNTSAVDEDSDEPVAQPKPVLRRPRLSISGLSGHFIRTSSQSSPKSSSRPLPVSDSNSSQGDFNLRSFRNVRRQDSTGSFLGPPVASQSSNMTGPMSSASVYATSPAPLSRQESFLSAEEYFLDKDSSLLYEDAIIPSPSLAMEVQQPNLSPSASKPSSPRSEAVRMMGGSISAGKFRRGSSRNLDEAAASPSGRNGTLTPVEGLGTQRSTRPSSPFVQIVGSPSETLAALEAELAKGRTTPLMSRNQGEDARKSSLGAALGISNADGTVPTIPAKDSSYFYLHTGESNGSPSKGISPLKMQADRQSKRGEDSNDIAPPKLPWMTDERDNNSKQIRRYSNAKQYSLTTSMTALQPAIKSDELPPTSDGDMQGLHADSPGSNTPTVKSADLASALQVSPMHSIFSASTVLRDEDRTRASPEEDLEEQNNDLEFTQQDRRNRKSNQILSNSSNGMSNGASNPQRRGGSMASLDYKSAFTIWPHRRESSSSSLPPIAPSKQEEMLSFHKQQAASLSANQRQNQIQPVHFQRIAWPSPPCIKLSYFSQLTALHQHSLFEQHLKAAEHALQEYLRLMAGVVPREAMIQPGPIFGAEGMSVPLNESPSDRKAQISDANIERHSRSRSISVPGLHGGGPRARSRSMVPFSSNTSHIPVPPLPTDTMIEKMEERAANGSRRIGVNRDLPQKRRSYHTSTSSSTNGHNSLTNIDYSPSSNITRRPSAKFMIPKHTNTLPMAALDGARPEINSSPER